MTLRELPIGQRAIVTKVGGSGALRQHFLDMGIIPGIDVKVVKYAPMGDPVEICLHGYELTLRLDDADKIDIMPIDEKTFQKDAEKKVWKNFHRFLSRKNPVTNWAKWLVCPARPMNTP